MKYIGLTILIFLIIYNLFSERTRKCTMLHYGPAIARVSYGPFRQYIPLTGMVVPDSIAGVKKVKLTVDEYYVEKISRGLKGTTTFMSHDYTLQITDIDSLIISGRFSVEMKFVGSTLPAIPDNHNIRLRLELGEQSNQILLPVGGFYKDTGGEWIFVIGNHDRAIRRNIKLGRKMGSEYFEVLDGLNPGDSVVTSTYELLDGEGFDGQDSVDIENFSGRFLTLHSVRKGNFLHSIRRLVH